MTPVRYFSFSLLFAHIHNIYGVAQSLCHQGYGGSGYSFTFAFTPFCSFPSLSTFQYATYYRHYQYIYSISIVFGTQYTKLMCNITIFYLFISPTCCCYTTLEICQVHNDTRKLKTLQLHSRKHNQINCSAQPSQLKFSYYSKCSKCPPFTFTQALSLFRHSSTASSMILYDSPFHVSLKRCFRSVRSRTGV